MKCSYIAGVASVESLVFCTQLYIVQYWLQMFNIAVPGNNNYEIMKFKDFQIPKFSRPYSVFKDFTGSGNMGTFSRFWKHGYFFKYFKKV